MIRYDGDDDGDGEQADYMPATGDCYRVVVVTIGVSVMS